MTDRAPILVIGVGSDLRSDDAAGRHVADRVRALGLSGVATLSVHQLAPELAAELVGRRLVVVADAAIDADTVTIEPVTAAESPGAMSHHLDVGVLLAMARLLGPPPTETVAVRVPAHDLGLGMALTDAAAAHVETAVQRLTATIDAVDGRTGLGSNPST